MDDRRAVSDILVICKYTLYKEWKPTTDEQEYLIKKEILELLIISLKREN